MIHIEIPELMVEDKQPLIDHYYATETSIITSWRQGRVTNKYKGLNFLELDTIPDCLDQIVKKINPDFFKGIYYCMSNSNIGKHKDYGKLQRPELGRNSAIGIELINEHNIPVSYEQCDVYYHVPVLMNTYETHWVNNANNEFRLFVQVELIRDHKFDDYVHEYRNGNLIV